jgi:hypothetical protein
MSLAYEPLDTGSRERLSFERQQQQRDTISDVTVMPFFIVRRQNPLPISVTVQQP